MMNSCSRKERTEVVSRSFNKQDVGEHSAKAVMRHLQEIFSVTLGMPQSQRKLSIIVPGSGFDQDCLLLSPRDANHKLHLNQMQN